MALYMLFTGDCLSDLLFVQASCTPEGPAVKQMTMSESMKASNSVFANSIIASRLHSGAYNPRYIAHRFLKSTDSSCTKGTLKCRAFMPATLDKLP
mmetsp:Transcript_46366/g.105127  ORF Transcript_46366/g.105127 Transcript_46366/m.105127 type:complete len:96 (-) Transcript_46366:202-489(-)